MTVDTTFLAAEALALVRSGRLVVVPAPLVGCTQSAVGWTDDLLAGGLLAGIMTAVRSEAPHTVGTTNTPPVQNLQAIDVPFIDGVPLPDLAAILDELGDWALPLKRAAHSFVEDARQESHSATGASQQQLLDASRHLRERLDRLARMRRAGPWRTSSAPGYFSLAPRSAFSPGHDPVTDILRSIAAPQKDFTPWVPYLWVEGIGGRVDWTCPIDNPSATVSASSPGLRCWLHPGTPGVGVRPIVVFSRED